MVSDRGPRFASRFWKAFCSLLGATVSLTSGYHPQSNGQTERLNQELKTGLRCMVSANLATWNKSLIWVEYAHNTLPCSSSGLSPFQCAYGRRRSMFLLLRISFIVVARSGPEPGWYYNRALSGRRERLIAEGFQLPFTSLGKWYGCRLKTSPFELSLASWRHASWALFPSPRWLIQQSCSSSSPGLWECTLHFMLPRSSRWKTALWKKNKQVHQTATWFSQGTRITKYNKWHVQPLSPYLSLSLTTQYLPALQALSFLHVRGSRSCSRFFPGATFYDVVLQQWCCLILCTLWQKCLTKFPNFKSCLSWIIPSGYNKVNRSTLITSVYYWLHTITIYDHVL